VAASLAALLTIGAAPAPAAMTIHLTDVYDHPGAKVGVNGSGFGAYATIDIYFDTTDELIVTANATGSFAKHTIPVPTDALPGEHWISAAERDNGQGVQKLFTVSTDWTEFGFDTRNRRNNPWENVISQGNVGTLDTMWSHKTGDVIPSSPAVGNGIAYVGSDDHNLYAFDVATGAVLWSVPTGDAVTSSPAVAAGTVYFGSDDGTFYAVDAATGTSKWSFSGNFPLDSSPAVANGIVYVASTAGTLFAFDATTGAELWANISGGSTYAAPAVGDGAVYVATQNGKVVAFDASTGTVLWTSTTSGTNSAPMFSGGSVWVLSSGDSAPYFLYRFRAADGFLISATNLGGSGGVETVEPAPAVANGIVYVSVGGTPGQVIALRPNGVNPTVLWTSNLDGAADTPTAPAIANGVLYVGSGLYGDFLALDAATGNTLWSGVTAGAFDFSSAAVSNGAVFIGGGNRLFAFALNGGNNAAYRRHHVPPPALSSLHPNTSLRVSQGEER
jgi:outer membrane protein assembly factor BamB